MALAQIADAEALLNDFKNAAVEQDRAELERLWHKCVDVMLGTGWRCFHCGDYFTDPYAARLHFGETADSLPECFRKLGRAPNNRLAYAEWLSHGERLRKLYETVE